MMDITGENIWNLKESALNQNISVRITLTGTSMRPFLQHGDIAIVDKVPITDLKRGDIIAFKILDKYIAHRLIKKIIEKNNYTLITKGDSCSEFDKPVFASDIIGKVSLIKRNNRIINLMNFRKRCISKLFAWFPKLSYYNYLLYYYIIPNPKS